ncbi:MAG: hypothetical protein Q8M16_02150 [Pirellulaceae bacterium]|nr:hypothetical protein [Pirellulaceae bacterium]
METLDLKRYQSAKLVEQLADVLNVGSAVVEVLRSVGWVIAVLVVVANFVLYLGGASPMTWALIAVYVLFVAGLLGGAIGLVRVARNFLRQTATVLQLMIGITNQARIDLNRVQTGEAKLPSTHEIMLHSYQDVIFPTVKQIVIKSGGLVSQALLWIYRKTIERTVLNGIRLAAETSQASGELGADQDRLEGTSREQMELQKTLAAVADSSADAETEAKAESWLRVATARIERWFLFPLMCGFWIVAAGAIVPVLVGWWLSR